jgi:DNA-binding transcriptional LysR family regulator
MDLKHIDLNLLVVFEAIYSAASISRAARQLGLSQPAVSNALARLRELTKDALFLRNKGGVAPTVTARRLIGPVREALGLIKGQLDAGPDVDLAACKRVFRIHVSDALEPIMLPPALRIIADRLPGISIENALAAADFAAGLRSGTLDLACLGYPLDAPDIIVAPIEDAEFVVIARRGHPRIVKTLDAATFASAGHVTLASDLRVFGNIDEHLAAAGITRRAVYIVNKVWSIAPIVERTDLLGVLPRSFAMEIAGNFAITSHAMPVKLPQHAAHMLWHERSTNDAVHRWLRETMLSAIGERQRLADTISRLVPPKTSGSGLSASRPSRINA